VAEIPPKDQVSSRCIWKLIKNSSVVFTERDVKGQQKPAADKKKETTKASAATKPAKTEDDDDAETAKPGDIREASKKSNSK
jgi:hypothetical protein